VANAAIIPAGTGGSISAFVSNDSDVVLDINGYFVEDSNALTFFPITPCRVSDTRPGSGKAGALGGPILTAQTTREIPVLTSGCGIAANVQAYSLNITAVPSGPLGFLTVWQSGQPRPLASTLNSANGQVVANAAIVSVAGPSPSINLFASDDTHVVIDINGFFAPPLPDDSLPNLNVNLSYYPQTPCRVADTRPESGMTGFFGPPVVGAQAAREFPVLSSSCNVNPNAKAYVLNATAVPVWPLGFLTLFPSGAPLPLASTLNSSNGQVVANMAIVQGGLWTGAISAFATDPTHLVLDISGYFAH
jgi:serine protease